jgi:hypothetical protein
MRMKKKSGEAASRQDTQLKPYNAIEKGLSRSSKTSPSLKVEIPVTSFQTVKPMLPLISFS